MLILPQKNERITFDISLPVSTNNLYSRSNKATVRKSDKYASWARTASFEIIEAKSRLRFRPLSGRFIFAIALPLDVGDVDNRTKAALDLLATMRVVPDDSMCHFSMSGFSPELEKDRARVSFWDAPEETLWLNL